MEISQLAAVETMTEGLHGSKVANLAVLLVPDAEKAGIGPGEQNGRCLLGMGTALGS